MNMNELIDYYRGKRLSLRGANYSEALVKILAAVLDELARAEKKHPHWPDDEIHKAAIVCEESGELLRAAIQFEREGGRSDAMKKEAVQTAAMAVRFLLNSPR